jgi:outer membrane protein
MRLLCTLKNFSKTIMKKIALLFICGLFIGSLAHAQESTHKELKMGYINSAELLQVMPEKVNADSALAKYARSFQTEIDAMIKEYQTKLQQYQGGNKTMTDAVREVKEKELQDLQNRIESTQQSAQEKVQQKKQEVYTPVLDKADKAIKEVSKEKGYDYVFDISNGALVYYHESDNILPLVKAKLGIK